MVTVVITGSSASGKTTLAQALNEKHQFHHIDGDQVIKDLGLTSKSWNLIHDQMINRALQLDSSVNVVISHVVLPEKFTYYQEKLAHSNRNLLLVVLQPTFKTLRDRAKIRKSHPKPTPPDAIDFFYHSFESVKATNTTQLVIDNSIQTEQESLEMISSYLKLRD